MKKYGVQELVFNCSRGGLIFESYLLCKLQRSEGGPKKHDNYALLQCLKVESNLRQAKKEV